jgi:hypothetical protein
VLPARAVAGGHAATQRHVVRRRSPLAARVNVVRRTSVRQRLVALILALTTTACTTWQPFVFPSAQSESLKLPYALRITRLDGSRLTVLSPFTRADTIFGRLHSDTVAILYRDIQRLERERFSPRRTAAVVLAIPVGFIITYLIVCSGGKCQPDYAN